MNFDFDFKWLVMFLIQLGGGIALVATQDDPSLRNIGIGMIGGAVGQGATANRTLVP
jgi:hypothetical protein